MNDVLAWTAPQPFWMRVDRSVSPRAQLSRPQILRFANDQFMDELFATLEHDPASLPRYAAAPETWRGPASTPAAQPERWLERKPALLSGLKRKLQAKTRALAGVNAGAVPSVTTSHPLKLYQPGHMRHYLVAGSLVCQRAGLPDRAVDAAREKVSFVVRRLFPKTPVEAPAPLPDPAATALWDEYAYVLQGKAGEWRRVGAAENEAEIATLATGEERLSLFPAFFTQDDAHQRRIYAGTVPVGRREAYQGAASGGESSRPSETEYERKARLALEDPRVALFHAQVLAPWKALISRVMKLDGSRPDWVHAKRPGSFDPETRPSFLPDTPDPDALRSARAGLQVSSWYLLLDLALFLQRHVPHVWQQIADGAAPTGSPLHAALASMTTWSGLRSTTEPGRLAEPNGAYAVDDISVDLLEALRDVVAFEADLEAAPNPRVPGMRDFVIPKPNATSPPSKPPGWPSFLFLVADPWFGMLTPPLLPGQTLAADDFASEARQARIDSLAVLLKDELPPLDPSKPQPEPTLATVQPADMREAWYVMRLVYDRPECAPFHTAVVSAPTAPFQMAGFFDPDAPARPVRIGLPVDISPAGLRKFDKNAVFVMSDMLCGQMDRMKGITLADLVLSVLPWPFHKDLSVPDKGPCKTGDGLSLGVMCSLSIPIVTIAALLLLMIIVSLLDFVFRWLPYLVMCLPLPGFKGKK